MKKLIERLKKFDYRFWTTSVSLLLTAIVIIYFTIGSSISMAKGLTLYGSFKDDVVLLSLFVILSILLVALFIYIFFFKSLNVTNNVANDNAKIMEEKLEKAKIKKENKTK